MQIGSGCTVHVGAEELPPGRLVLKLSRHMAAVIDGVLRDTYDCSRRTESGVETDYASVTVSARGAP